MTDNNVTIVPTSSMRFEKQVRVLRAYVVLSEYGTTSVHYKDVMRASEMARTQISGVNSFLVDLGLLKQTAKGVYIPTESTVAFYSREPGNEDYSVLTLVIKESALYLTVRNRILIHGDTNRDEMLEYLLQQSGERTKSRAKRSLQRLERTSLILIDQDEQVQIL